MVPANDLQICMDRVGQQYSGVWRRKLCWMQLHEKIHSGRSGDVSELAAVVRAATEGMGLQSIVDDFGLCGHVAI